MDAFLRLTVQYLILLCLFGIVALLRIRKVEWKFAFFALLIEAIEYSFNFIFRRMPPLTGGSFFSHWNWSGKLASALFMVAILTFASDLRRQSGLTAGFKEGGWKLWLPGLFVVALWSIYDVDVSFFPTAPDWPSIAFQSIMPSTEELFFRGIAVCLLLRAFGSIDFGRLGSISFAAILTCIWFGLAHGVQFNDGKFSFDSYNFQYTVVAGALFLWLRRSSGTIWIAMLGHSLDNVLHYLPIPKWFPWVF